MFSVDKSSNFILCNMSNDELMKLFRRINKEPLRFRSKLNLPDYVSFGNEIEFNDSSLDKTTVLVEIFNDVNNLSNEAKYSVHEEMTTETGAEVVTPILTDTITNWSVFYDMYDMLYDTGATISDNTASHLHIGTHMINTPEKLSLLLKTLVVFEPIIFKFGYGYSEEPRHFLRHKPDMSVFSPMMSPKRVSTFTDVLDHYNYNCPGLMSAAFKDFLAQELRFRPVFTFNDFDFNKLQYNIAGDNPSTNDHIEIRCFNGTLDPEIAQNNINLITRIIVAVIEDKIDKDYVLTEYAKYKKKRYNFDVFCALLDEEKKGPQYNRLLDGFNKIKLEKALRLADMIFDTELDKCFFLKQYLKLFNAKEEEIVNILK